jgi:D-3-phosphoglycerate dehydrogenase
MGFKVVAQLPAHIPLGEVEDRYAWELEAFHAIDAEICEVAAASEDEFVRFAHDADALITSWGFPITRRIIEGLRRCVVIGVGSVGVDTVDVDAATEAGIVVTNTPDIFIEEVADHALALILSCARRIVEQDEMVRDERWSEGRPQLSHLPRKWGRVLGLVSFGNVARATARRAAAFGVHLLAYDPFVSELRMTAEGVEPVTSLGELLERSDIVSVHTPYNRDTHHLIGAAEIARMRDDAILVNTGRGGVVDEEALARAMAGGKLWAAALDVLEQEPPPPDHPLSHCPTSSCRPTSPRQRHGCGRRPVVGSVARWRWSSPVDGHDRASIPACYPARRSSVGSPIRATAAPTGNGRAPRPSPRAQAPGKHGLDLVGEPASTRSPTAQPRPRESCLRAVSTHSAAATTSEHSGSSRRRWICTT